MSRLRFITTEPPNAGTPLELLDGRELNPADIYMRNNFSIPEESSDTVSVDLLGRTFTLDLTAIETVPPTEIDMVLECAGNGRIFMEPVPKGTPWDLGGVSPVRFGGVRLVDALGPIPDEAEELVFTGSDYGEVEPEGVINYQFSLQPEEWARALLATRLGPEPLPREHGGPIRVVVPGHYAMKSVKWLTSIVATAKPFDGHFVNKYRYFGDTTQPEAAPVREIQVRSLIAHPFSGSVVAPGGVTISGTAWSGYGSIASVEVSVNNSEWVSAQVNLGVSPYSAASWELKLDLSPGGYNIGARAEDTEGNIQPSRPRWNRNGYGNNLIHRVEFEVVAGQGTG